MFRKRNHTSGFTAIEMVVVIAVISVLAGAALANLIPLIKDSKIARMELDLRQFQTALSKVFADTGFPPENGGVDIDPGLATKPTGSGTEPANWKGPYIMPYPLSTPFGKGLGAADGYNYDYGTTKFTYYNNDTLENEASINILMGVSAGDVIQTIDRDIDDGIGTSGVIIYSGTPSNTFDYFIGEGPVWATLP